MAYLFSDRKRYGSRQNAVTVELKSRDTMYLSQGVGVKNRYEAELTNQRRGSGPKIYAYSAVPHGGAEWSRYYRFLSSAQYINIEINIEIRK